MTGTGEGALKMKRFIAMLAAMVLLASLSVWAQEDSEEAMEEDLLTEGESLYTQQGKRDPFTPLVVMGGEKPGGKAKVRPKETGIGRFTVESCLLEIIATSPSQGTVAWFQGPDNKAYKVLVGDEFADGKVLSISLEEGEVIVRQELVQDVTEVKPFRDLPLSIRWQGGKGK